MMKIRVKFFGVLSEVVGENDIVIKGNSTLLQLKQSIIDRHPSLKDYKYRISVNRVIIGADHKLNEGDEVAFLPPFAGG